MAERTYLEMFRSSVKSNLNLEEWNRCLKYSVVNHRITSTSFFWPLQNNAQRGMATVTQIEMECISLKCVFRDGHVVDSWRIVCYCFVTYYLCKNLYCVYKNYIMCICQWLVILAKWRLVNMFQYSCLNPLILPEGMCIWILTAYFSSNKYNTCFILIFLQENFSNLFNTRAINLLVVM